MDGARWLGREVEVEVEIPRGGRVKRRADGSVDYVSPVGAPFNYGCLPEEPGGDGDPLDAILFGPTLAVGARAAARVVGVVRFIDRGMPDDKLICHPGQIKRRERWLIHAFFGLLTPVRRALHVVRGDPPGTRVVAVEWWPGAR
jgi:inorganic pyrophosphatase